MSEKEGGLSSLFDFLSKLVAIVVLLAMGFKTIVGLLAYFGVNFEPNVLSQILYYQELILEWAALVMAGLVALEFGFKHGFITILIVAILLAIVILPKFFPDIWDKVENIIKTATE